MSKERCSENAFCEVCRFGTFNAECRASKKQREMIGQYGGYENFELIDFCYNKDQQIADLEARLMCLKNNIIDDETLKELVKEHRLYKDLEEKLAESEKSKESYRLQNDEHHLQLCQFYSRLGVEAFGADIHEKALETLMIMKEQLAEKDEQINMLEEHKFYADNIIQSYADKCKNAHQDKISLCIEQLEKVKETAECVLDNALKNSSLNQSYYDRLLDEIDNQINEIKGE